LSITPKNIGQLPVIDSLRAFAAISVCLFHFVCTITGFIDNSLIRNVFSFGKYGVQTFFVISGFVLPWSMYNSGFSIKNFGTFMLKRIIRLEPPYVVSVVIAVILIYIRNVFYVGDTTRGFELNLKQLLSHFGYLVPFFKDVDWLNIVYWTLAVEFQYYLFIALFFFMLVNSNLWLKRIFHVVLLFSVLIGDVNFLPHWLAVFGIGILLFQLKSKMIGKPDFFILSLIYLCFMAWHYPLIMLPFVLIPVIALLYFEQLKVVLLNTIGKFSYSFYLMHTLIGSSFLNVMSHHVYSAPIKFILVLTAILLSLAVSYFLYVWVEKPSKNLSSSLKFTKSP